MGRPIGRSVAERRVIPASSEEQHTGSLVEELLIPTPHGCEYKSVECSMGSEVDETYRLKNAEWPSICIQLVHGWDQNGYVFMILRQ
jgi:hypothetical protein